MSHVVVLGAGLGGVTAAYEIKERLGSAHQVSLVNRLPDYQYVPSNPWLAVGWRKPEQIAVPLREPLARHRIELIVDDAVAVEPAQNRLRLASGTELGYDYLVICTGPELAFDEVPGLGPDDGHTQSICTLAHAQKAWEHYQAFLANPGPIVIGAAQGASCFGPAYEFALIVDADLRKRKIRHKVPITYVTSEPYIGHMGLGGVGDSKSIMESEFRQHDIKWITNVKIDRVEAGKLVAIPHRDDGTPADLIELPFAYSMILPAFRGVGAVRAAADLCNPRGFVLVDEFQCNPTHRNVYSAGVCIAIPPVDKTPVPTGAPKTGYMIESMVKALTENIALDIAGQPPAARATWNAICLADMGTTGIAFVAMPEIPPRNVTWAKKGKWVHGAKIALEKYFLHKVRTGHMDPVYERMTLKALGIHKLEAG